MTDQILEKISKLVISREASESDVDHLMTLIRKLEEKNGKKLKDYPLIDLFSNWTKHTSIGWNASCQKIILELNEELCNLLQNESDANETLDRIEKTVSFERLQNELHSFLYNYHLPLDLVTIKKCWLRFIVLLIEIISDCPLNLSKKGKQQIKNYLAKNTFVTALTVTWVETKTEDVLALAITLSNGNTIFQRCKVLGKYLTRKDTQNL